MNRFKQKLTSGEAAYGQMVMEFFTPGMGPILAAAGMDFVVFDTEHGRCDVALGAELVASCRGSDIVPIIRVPDVRTAPLARVLDCGARGVMVPRVETRQQMEDIVAEVKYAPQGRRGVALGIAHDLYKPGGPEYFQQANEDISVIAIMETAKAYENLDDILSVPGLDVAWMGHYDLTVSLGIPAQFDNPRFLDCMQQLISTAKKHNVAAGFLPVTPDEAIHWIHEGFRAIMLGTDISVFSTGMKDFHGKVLEGLGPG